MFVNIVQGLLEESQDSDWLVIASILHPSVSPSVGCIVASFLLLSPDLILIYISISISVYMYIFLFDSAQKNQLQLSACPQPQICHQVVKMLIFFPLLNCQHSAFTFWVNQKKKPLIKQQYKQETCKQRREIQAMMFHRRT